MNPRESHKEALQRIEKAREEDSFSLYLGDLSLKELPKELGTLTELRALTLGDRIVDRPNWWHGEFENKTGDHWFDNLEVLCPLTGLTHLGLANCSRLSDIGPLGELVNLRELDLEYCDGVDDLGPLARLTRLRFLDVSRGDESEGPSDITPLEGLNCLQRLDLSGFSELHDIDPLTKLIDLRELNLSHTAVASFVPLGGLTNLRKLQSYWCRQLRILGSLKRMTGLRNLILYGCQGLRDIGPLAGLVNLQKLDLGACKSLGDIGPLAQLARLKELHLYNCEGVRNLSPIASMSGLRKLNLSGCKSVRSFQPLRGLLDSLEELNLYEASFEDLPKELCGGGDGGTTLDRVRAHFADLEQGAQEDVELKLFVLGNGGVGKTQLCRRLRQEPFDPTIPSTHGVQLGQVPIEREGGGPPIRLCCWDFGGQDIYHGTHALFLQGQAVFLILWTPRHEDGETTAGDIVVRNRPLAYWLDYVRGLVGTENPVLVVQGHCDQAGQRREPDAPGEGFRFLRTLAFSARNDLGREALVSTLREAVVDLLGARPLHQLGVGRLRVRDRLRALLNEGTRTLTHEAFRALCADAGNVSDPDALLDFLHRCGVLFYRPGLFEDRIILDQTWALDATYSLLHRQATVPALHRDGRFTRTHLAGLAWRNLAAAEQEVVFGLMRSCGLCFPTRNRSPAGDAGGQEYIAPDLLPEWSQAKAQLLGGLRDGPPDAQATVRYRFLHEGILRTFLSRIGEQAGDGAVYWKYGCWFCEEKTESVALVQGRMGTQDGQPGAGEVSLQAWGKVAGSLVDRVLKTLLEVPVGRPPEVERGKKQRSRRPARRDDARGVEALTIVPRSHLPDDGSRWVYVSYAWGDDTPVGRQREQLVEDLCVRLRAWGYDVVRDKEAMRPGDLISTFMKTIGKGDRVVVVLGEKYLRSVHCLTELHEIYRVSRGEKDDFLRRIIPLTLPDTAIATTHDRAAHARHWKAEHDSQRAYINDGLLGPSDLQQWSRIGRWVVDVSEMLAHINDQLHPSGFDAIAANDFAAVKALLERGSRGPNTVKG